MYEECARLYDTPLRDKFSHQCAKLSLSVFKGRKLNPPTAIVDLGCGTGLLCHLLENAGHSVTGVDASSQMLELARQRKPNSRVEFLEADIRNFRREESFGAALCFGDVLNHLLSEHDVKALIESAFHSLSPGGVFLADSTTWEAYTSELWDLDGLTEERDGENVTVRGSFDDKQRLGRIEVTAGSGSERITEVVEQRYHSEDFIKSTLKNAGFTSVIRQDFNPLPSLSYLKALKNIWLAVK